MARKPRRSHHVAGELNLTAMIDVAFQLLSFFIMTSKPVDILANLDVSRPAPDARATANKPLTNVMRITVLPGGKFTLNDRLISPENLDMILCQVGEQNKDQTVLIGCTPDSTHADMVKVLDLCLKAGLGNLSVLSVN